MCVGGGLSLSLPVMSYSTIVMVQIRPIWMWVAPTSLRALAKLMHIFKSAKKVHCNNLNFQIL